MYGSEVVVHMVQKREICDTESVHRKLQNRAINTCLLDIQSYMTHSGIYMNISI